jgi:fluoroacetyl-CoA thioesterase
MKSSLKPGLKLRFSYTVPVTKTVPHLYAEAPELQAMPEVFATGFMVGLMEWTCVQLRARGASAPMSTCPTNRRHFPA